MPGALTVTCCTAHPNLKPSFEIFVCVRVLRVRACLYLCVYSFVAYVNETLTDIYEITPLSLVTSYDPVVQLNMHVVISAGNYKYAHINLSYNQ